MARYSLEDRNFWTVGQRGEGLSPAGHIAVYVRNRSVQDLSQVVVLGELATLSVSLHRDVFRVLGLGRCYPWGFSRSSHLIGGSLEFRTLHEEALIEAYRTDRGRLAYRTPLELPPFEIVSLLCNDEGDIAIQILHDVLLIDGGMVIGIDLPVIQQTYTWLAGGLTPLQLVKTGGPPRDIGQVLADQARKAVRTTGTSSLPNGILY